MNEKEDENMSFNDSATLDNLGYGFATQSIYSEDKQTDARINEKIIELNNIINQNQSENIPNRPNGLPNSSHGHRDYRLNKSAGSNRNHNKTDEALLIGSIQNSTLLNEGITTIPEVPFTTITRPKTVGFTESRKTPEIPSTLSLTVSGLKRKDNGTREKITNAVMFM
jgi:hypothetical protein